MTIQPQPDKYTPNLQYFPNNFKNLFTFTNKVCFCHKWRLTADAIVGHFKYDQRDRKLEKQEL